MKEKNNIMQKTPIKDAHFTKEKGEEVTRKALGMFAIPESKINKIIARYPLEVIRETGSQLQLAFKQNGEKQVEIPSINAKKIGDFTIADAKPKEYPFISSLMGMIVDCCAYHGGSGSTLCLATKLSPWFKVMLIKKGEEVQGLTVVCSDVAKKNLVILGLEVAESNLSASKKNTFNSLIQYASEEMLKNSNYEQVLFSGGGKGLPNIGYGSKPLVKQAQNIEDLMQIFEGLNLKIIDSRNMNFDIQDGESFGFDTLADIPENAICTELISRKLNINSNIEDAKHSITPLDFNNLPNSSNTKSLYEIKAPKQSVEKYNQNPTLSTQGI